MEATVEAPSAQTRKDYTGRPGALSHFYRISRDGWKSKFKDLEPGMVQLRVTAIPEVAIHWSSGFSRFTDRLDVGFRRRETLEWLKRQGGRKFTSMIHPGTAVIE